MSADAYLQTILDREAVDTSVFSPVRRVQGLLDPILRVWAGNCLISLTLSGSFAKSTANRTVTDFHLFISLSPQTIESLGEIHNKVFRFMTAFRRKSARAATMKSTTPSRLNWTVLIP